MDIYNHAVQAAGYIKEKISLKCTVGVICGSGLGGFADKLENAVEISTMQIPNFKSSTVKGHAGTLVVGKLGDVSVVAVKGRLHTYDGHSVQDTVFVVRVLAILGVKTLIVTNAAGGVNEKYRVGDLMVINDHINLPGMAGVNPLKGPNVAEFGGPRFLATNNAYSHELRYAFFQVADSAKLSRNVHEGIYTMLTGPTYESAAEVRLVRQWGGDAVGMSSVPEVLTALHCGMQVMGLSLITNEGISDPPRSGREPPAPLPPQLDHSEVVAVAAQAAEDVELLVCEFIQKISK